MNRPRIPDWLLEAISITFASVLAFAAVIGMLLGLLTK